MDEARENAAFIKTEQLQRLDAIRRRRPINGGRSALISLKVLPWLSISVYNKRTVMYFFLGLLVAWFKYTKFKTYFSILIPIELTVFTIYCILFFWLCFVDTNYVQYRKHKEEPDFDFEKIKDVVSCMNCLTGVDQRVKHCHDCDCCVLEWRHHCSFLDICMDKVKYPVFGLNIVCWIFFALATYWELFKLITITIGALKDMDFNSRDI